MLLRLLESGLAIMYLLAFFGCTLRTVETTETEIQKSLNGKVLIATQSSQFKRTVVSEIQNNLEDNVFYVRVVDLKWLPNESAADFNAIVILNRYMAGRPDPRVERFVDPIPDKKKVILLTTGQRDSWKPESSEIDAISSASAMSETAPLARSISDKILDIIESQDDP